MATITLTEVAGGFPRILNSRYPADGYFVPSERPLLKILSNNTLQMSFKEDGITISITKGTDAVIIGGDADSYSVTANYTLVALQDTINVLFPKATPIGGDGGSATTDASQLTSGTLPDARLSQNITKRIVPSNTYYLSKHGAVSDADLVINSTVFGTDSTLAIQSVLNNASSTNDITVFWDGKHSVTGLIIKSNTTIIVSAGCGAILRNGANNTLLRNEHFVFANNDNIVDKNITIDGGIWNGNSAGQTAKGDPTNGFYDAMHFYGVKNLTVKNFTIYTPKTYAIHATNIVNGLYQKGIVDVGNSGAINMDGVHFDGWCKDCTIRDMWINANDDAIGLNADDQYRNTAVENVALIYPFFPANTCGAISNILIENIHLESQLFGIRILSGTSRVDNITIRNVTGFTKGYGLIMDNYIPNPAALLTYNGDGNIGKINIENFDVAIPTASYLTAPIVVGANIEQLNIKSLIHRSHTVVSPAILVHYKTIGLLRISESSVINTGAVISAPLVRNEGIITETQLLGITARNINNIIDDAGGMVYISATNIRHTGATAGEGTFKTSSTVTDLVVSNYFGDLVNSGSGTFTAKRGDAIAGYVNGTNPSSSDPMAAYILYDDFNRSDSTTTMGNLEKPNTSGTIVSGTWGISSTNGYDVTEVTTGAATFHRRWWEAGVSDYTYSIDVKKLSSPIEFELLFRYTDASNHWVIATSNGTISLFKQVAGAFAQVGSTNTWSYTDGTYTNIKVVISGNNITVYRDGISVITATDGFNNTATKVGIAVVSGSGYGGGVRFKNLKLG